MEGKTLTLLIKYLTKPENIYMFCPVSCFCYFKKRFFRAKWSPKVMCPNLHILLLLFIALNPQNVHHCVGLESPSWFDSSFVKATHLNRIRLWDRNSANLFFPSVSSGFPFSTPLAWDRAPQRDSEKGKKTINGVK